MERAAIVQRNPQRPGAQREVERESDEAAEHEPILTARAMHDPQGAVGEEIAEGGHCRHEDH